MATGTTTNLSVPARGAPPAASRAHGYDFEPCFESTQHVVYRGLEEDFYGCPIPQLLEPLRPERRRRRPAGCGRAVRLWLDQQGTQHIVYRGADNNGTSIHELWWNRSGWHHEPLTQQTGAPPTASEPFGYVFSWDGTQHVDYVGTNGHIDESGGTRPAGTSKTHRAHRRAARALRGAGVWNIRSTRHPA